jgi:hypothetical protein
MEQMDNEQLLIIMHFVYEFLNQTQGILNSILNLCSKLLHV